MADIIVGSQHGPNNSGLFGIVQSPIRPLRPPVLSTEPRMTATQMAQVDVFSRNFTDFERF